MLARSTLARTAASTSRQLRPCASTPTTARRPFVRAMASAPQPAAEIPKIIEEAAQAAELMSQGYAYCDVRTPEEFHSEATEHAKGAVNVDFRGENFVEEFKRTFPGEAKVIVACEKGGRSRQASELLAASYPNPNLVYFKGSLQAWKAAGMPTER